MALSYLMDRRPDRFVAVVVDEANDEITHIAFRNMSADDWDIRYKWRNQQLNTFTVSAGTDYLEIGIPPGQRKWIQNAGPRGGIDSELARGGG